MTLPARIGAGPSRMLYLLLTVIAYLVPVLLWLSGSAVWVLLSLLSLPLAVSTLRTLYGSEGRELNSVLAATGKLMTIHGALLSAGLLFN